MVEDENKGKVESLASRLRKGSQEKKQAQRKDKSWVLT